MKQSGFAIIFIPIILVITGGLIAGAYFLGTVQKSNPQLADPVQETNSTPILQKENAKDQEFQISGSEITQGINGQKNVLFKNVIDVSEARRGPDGKTIHFKVKNYQGWKDQRASCANLEAPLQSLPSDYGTAAPPTAPPWDFQKVGHAYTIHNCNNNEYSGGYLKTGDYFVYLKLISNTQGLLFYENLQSGEIKQLQINSNLLSGLNDGVDPIGNKPGKGNTYWVEAIVGKDGVYYFYPQQDSLFQNKNLILAFGNLILAINIDKNTLIGEFVQQDVVATSFRFLSKSNLPFLVVESAWEGPAIFNEIIDLSSDKLKLVDLTKLDKRSFNDFEVEPIVWEGDAIMFNFTDYEDATKKLPSSYDFDKLPIGDQARMDQIDRDAEKYLKDNFKYLEAKCSLGPGMVSGCDGLKKVDHYRYTSSAGLVKI